MIDIELNRLFVKVSSPVLEPPNHPLIHGFPAGERPSVRAGTDEKTYLLFSTVKTIPTPSFLVNKLDSSRCEIILLCSLQQPRRGSGQLHKIRHIQSSREKMWPTHF